MKKAKWLVYSLVLALTVSIFAGGGALLAAAEDAVDEQPWKIYCPEGDESLFYFENDNIAKIEATLGVTTDQFTNNYAIRNNPKSADEAYTVEATFRPMADQAAGVERTYGIVPWYVDDANYLLFWMQVKPDGAFSGQFYGKVGGKENHKKYVYDDNATSWLGNEFDDMWWDNGGFMPENVLGIKNAPLTESLALKVEVSNVTQTGTGEACKKFVLHFIGEHTDGSEHDVIARTVYVKDTATQGNVTAGVYANNFDVQIEGFNFSAASDTVAVEATEAKIDAIPAATATDYVAKVCAASDAYKALADNKHKVNSTKAAVLIAAEDALATEFDDLVTALDSQSATYKQDVETARALYNSFNSVIANKTTKSDDLSDAEYDLSLIVAAEVVVAKIDEIPSALTADSRAKVTAARTAYDGLTSAQKAKVPAAKLTVLTNAEAAFAAADAVIAKIAAIPETITAESQTAITDAREAYNALTETQKALIAADQLKVLTDAEDAFKALGDEEEASGCGSFVATGSIMFLLATLGAAVVVLKKRKSKI